LCRLGQTRDSVSSRNQSVVLEGRHSPDDWALSPFGPDPFEAREDLVQTRQDQSEALPFGDKALPVEQKSSGPKSRLNSA
jgi:hypothetical protein